MVVLIATAFDKELYIKHKPEVQVVDTNMRAFSNGESKPLLQKLKDDYKNSRYLDYSFRVLNKEEIRQEPKETFDNLSMGDFKKLLDYI